MPFAEGFGLMLIESRCIGGRSVQNIVAALVKSPVCTALAAAGTGGVAAGLGARSSTAEPQQAPFHARGGWRARSSPAGCLCSYEQQAHWLGSTGTTTPASRYCEAWPTMAQKQARASQRLGDLLNLAIILSLTNLQLNILTPSR